MRFWPSERRAVGDARPSWAESRGRPIPAGSGGVRPGSSAESTRAARAAGDAILKSGVVEGMAYTLYADGSIEAELPDGTVRFGSIAELRAHIESNLVTAPPTADASSSRRIPAALAITFPSFGRRKAQRDASSCSSVLPSAWGHRERHGRDVRRMMRNGPRSGASTTSASSCLSHRLVVDRGAQKLGQPVPGSNLVLDENSEAPQQTHLKRPGRLLAVERSSRRGAPCHAGGRREAAPA